MERRSAHVHRSCWAISGRNTAGGEIRSCRISTGIYRTYSGRTWRGQDPLKVEAGTAKKLERLIKGVPASRLRKRPAPGKWSVAEILAHLADSEVVRGWRMRQILGAPGTPIQAYDQDAWAMAGRYEKRDPRISVELFRAPRGKLDPVEVPHAGTMETPRRALRAGRGVYRAYRADVRGARHQPHQADRANPGGEEKQLRVDSRELKAERVSTPDKFAVSFYFQ